MHRLSPHRRTLRAVLPLLVVGVLAAAAIVVIVRLADSADESRRSELTLAEAEIALNRLQGAPFQASGQTGGSPAYARAVIDHSRRTIDDALRQLRRGSPPSPLRRVPGPLADDYADVEQIYRIGAAGHGYDARADRLSIDALGTSAQVAAMFDQAEAIYTARAARASEHATVGSAVVIVALVLAFAFLYRRALAARALAECLAHENGRLLEASRSDARTDLLTGLGNRRALADDLALLLAPGASDGLVLALFDLDGFKLYNDRFGHPAGDAMLAGLACSLAGSVAARGSAYRMGGDEFCVLLHANGDDPVALVRLAAAALARDGEAFAIGCSHGAVRIPEEARTAADALRLADERLYRHKAGRSSASTQSAGVLLQLVRERHEALHERLSSVAVLAARTAAELGLPDAEIDRIRVAGELHDVGMIAMPDALLEAPGVLDEAAWALIHCHTLIGERILRAAPALEDLAGLVRSTHERVDGGGYPDGAKGDEIPIGARVIAACAAFDAMVSPRPYRPALEVPSALAELRRNAGTQFDADVVAAFCRVVASSPELRRAA
jgi:diguanylate cyclase (GGDEF)-like protein